MDRVRLIMLCGLPAAGKSAYAEQLAAYYNNTDYYDNDVIIISSDQIRKRLYGDEEIQGNPKEVFGLMHRETLRYLNKGIDVIYDATNINRKSRRTMLSLCPKFANVECHIVWDSIENCIQRDKTRPRSVGEKVIKRMAKSFQAPFYDEGFDQIKVYTTNWTAENAIKYEEKIRKEMDALPDNSNQSVLEHCQKAHDYIFEYISKHADTISNKSELIYATDIHDLGKAYIAATENRKEEQNNEQNSEAASAKHYYNHQNIGAWMSYGLCTSVYEAWLISAHMDKAQHTKYYDRLPEYLKNNLDMLYQADYLAAK